jgi:hypothetical protein
MFNEKWKIRLSQMMWESKSAAGLPSWIKRNAEQSIQTGTLLGGKPAQGSQRNDVWDQEQPQSQAEVRRGSACGIVQQQGLITSDTEHKPWKCKHAKYELKNWAKAQKKWSFGEKRKLNESFNSNKIIKSKWVASKSTKSKELVE